MVSEVKVISQNIITCSEDSSLLEYWCKAHDIVKVCSVFIFCIKQCEKHVLPELLQYVGNYFSIYTMNHPRRFNLQHHNCESLKSHILYIVSTKLCTRVQSKYLFFYVEACNLPSEKKECIILGEGLCRLLCAYKTNVSIREGKWTSYLQKVTCAVTCKVSSSPLYRSAANQYHSS